MSKFLALHVHAPAVLLFIPSLVGREIKTCKKGDECASLFGAEEVSLAAFTSMMANDLVDWSLTTTRSTTTVANLSATSLHVLLQDVYYCNAACATTALATCASRTRTLPKGAAFAARISY
jgi:hypothetical protein